MEKGGAESLSGPEVRACESVEGRGSEQRPSRPRRQGKVDLRATEGRLPDAGRQLPSRRR